jgi:metal-responsive CopG/Arc/MetJ family transcriptional regulator
LAPFDELRKYVQKDAPAVEAYDRQRQISIVFNPQMLSAIDSWSSKNSITSRAEAVRRLIDAALNGKR